MEVLAIVLLCLLVYSSTLRFSLIVDDIRYADSIQRGLFANRKWGFQLLTSRLYGVGTFAKINKCRACKGHRKLPVHDNGKIQEVACHQCAGTGRSWQVDPFVEHGFTLFLHTLASVLVFFALGHNSISFAAALLYAIHPTNTQTSIWLNGRRYLINVIIVLTMMILGPLAAPLYFVTPFFQVNAIFAHVIYGWWGLALTAAAVIYAWPRWLKARVDSRMKSILNPDMRTWHPGRFIIIIKTFGFYTMQMVLPQRTMVVYPFIANWGLNKQGNKDAYSIDLYFVIGFLAIGLSSFGFLTLQGPEKWWVAFGFLALLQQCNIIPATQTIADRYCSIPIIFVAYFLAKTAGPIGCIIIGTYYLTSLFAALPLFKDINSYYDYHLYFDPFGTIVRKFKINWMLKSHDVMGAWELIKQGIIRNPNDFAMLYQAAICMAQMGDTKMFTYYLDKAEENHYIGQEEAWGQHLKDLRKANNDNKKNRIGAMSPKDYAQRIK